MKIIKDISSMRKFIKQCKLQNKSIGFVPTMGALHEGHLSLIKKARRENDIVIVSIFVNPLQFGANEDLKKYPRPINKDKKLLQKENIDILFLPTNEIIYPHILYTYVDIDKLKDCMCGLSRPTHFIGVLTVVAKLFNIITPDKTYFGQKDYQQAMIIKKMIMDLNFPVEIIICPIVREKSGLALSSRNIYLNDKEKVEALGLINALNLGKEIIKKNKNVKFVTKKMKDYILKNYKNIKIDYLDMRNADTLEEIKYVLPNMKILLCGAIYVGKTRLIDNIIL
jgi:pantoate--beta-alanine ligase